MEKQVEELKTFTDQGFEFTVFNDNENIQKRVSEAIKEIKAIEKLKILQTMDIHELRLMLKDFKNIEQLINYLKKFNYAGGFSGSGIITMRIPDYISSIRQCAFRYCAKLKQININKVAYIGEEPFNDCCSLEKIMFGNFNGEDGHCSPTEIMLGVDFDDYCLFVIDKGAFSECVSLKEIIIPKSVLYIGEEAFAYCNALEQVDFRTNVLKCINKGVF